MTWLLLNEFSLTVEVIIFYICISWSWMFDLFTLSTMNLLWESIFGWRGQEEGGTQLLHTDWEVLWQGRNYYLDWWLLYSSAELLCVCVRAPGCCSVPFSQHQPASQHPPSPPHCTVTIIITVSWRATCYCLQLPCCGPGKRAGREGVKEREVVKHGNDTACVCVSVKL